MARRTNARWRLPWALPLMLTLTASATFSLALAARPQDAAADEAARARAEAERRAQANAERRASASARRKASAQSKLPPDAQAGSAARSSERSDERSRARTEARSRQRERAQAGAQDPTQSAPRGTSARDPEQVAAARRAERDREADRLRHGLKSRGGTVQHGRPVVTPDEEYWEPEQGAEAAARHPLQNPSRRGGSIARGQSASPDGQPRAADWNSMEDRYEHPDVPLDFAQARREIDQSVQTYGRGMRSTPYMNREYRNGWWTWDRGRTRSWVSDYRPYRPAYNEFYAVDARRAASASRDRAANAGIVADSGARIPRLPSTAVEVASEGDPLFYDRGVFFRDAGASGEYEVVDPPLGTIVPTLPGGYSKVDIDGQRYNVFDGIYYKSVYIGGDFAFQVTQVDR